jgi:ParB/RepB/Spo0J family partition protein
MTVHRRPPAEPKAGMVKLDDVVFHPRNVRTDLGDLRELADSITQVGLLQPIVVERYGDRVRLRAGHRRVAAALLAGLTKLPAFIHPEALNEADWVLQALHENTKRRALDPQERADAIVRLKQLGRSTMEIARHLGVSEGTIRNWAAGVDTTPTASSEPTAEQPARERRSAGSNPLARGRSSMVKRTDLTRLVTAWRRYPDATLFDVLAALDKVAATGYITDALPPTTGQSAEEPS